MPGTRKLGRTTDHRNAMLRNMVTSLIENGKMTTTVTRAKEVRAMAEKMITIAKEDNLHNRRQVASYITKSDVVKKLFNEVAPKYKDVNGGYCRIIKTEARRGCGYEVWSNWLNILTIFEKENQEIVGSFRDRYFTEFELIESTSTMLLTMVT